MATKKKDATKADRKVVLTGEQLEILMGTNAISTLAMKELPAKTAYRVSRIVDKLTKEWKVYGETRKKLLEQYAEKDEDGKPKFTDETQTAYDITPANREKLSADMDSIREEVIELDINKLDMSADEILEILEEKGVTLTSMEASVFLTIAD
jgi:mRNA degradation ribonuclease J1/J2